jgi:hypothetical protein
VQPRQAEEVQAGRLGDAALVHEAALAVEDGGIDPRVVGPEAGRPDDSPRVELLAILEGHGSPRRVDGAVVKVDPVSAAQRPRSRADQRVPPLQPPAIRDAVVWRISPVASGYQNRSRPKRRWGSGVCREPIDRWTSREADSSSAI